MTETSYKTALIVGVGSGLSASLARLFAKNGIKVALAARRADNLKALAQETLRWRRMTGLVERLLSEGA